MRRRISGLALAALACALASTGCLADPTDAPPAARRSGYDYMSRETRAMQDDDSANPGMLYVLEGETLWKRKEGAAARACSSCHGDATESMKGVAARYPAYDGARGRLVDLEQRIDACRVAHQQAAPLGGENRELLALSAYVSFQSRGMPIDIAVDARSRPLLEAGRETYLRRMGQLNLSCAQCHDERAGLSLAGNPVPQAHPTGYPVYRLEWQALGSLSRRIRNCMIGTRAEPFEPGSREMTGLEYYLMWRARGMKMEAPAVRP